MGLLPVVMAAQGGGTPAGSMVVTLVGTGGPELTAEREGESTLVEVSGQELLFDAGRGTLEGLYRSQVLPQRMTRVFLTHLHSDHIAGLADLWMTPWFLLGRREKLEVWGPAGTAAMIAGMRAMYGHDVEHRANAVLRREDLEVTVHEIAPGVVYAQDGVKVTATAVEHADGDPALAYRVEGAGRTLFLTGDCTYTEAMAAAARGADVVVANVAAGSFGVEGQAWLQPILNKLLRPEQAARLFAEVKPKLAVYSHVVKKDLPGAKGDAEMVRRTRKAGYAGRLLMGEDHMRIVVGESVRVMQVGAPVVELDGPGARF
jgi:ribonuclease Z